MKKLLSNLSNLNKIESAVQYTTEFSERYIECSTKTHRKKLGQFFTPDVISYFMAGLSQNNPMRVLDPGAGLGVLSCAIAERMHREHKSHKLHIDLYEKDLKIVPLLEQSMKFARSRFPFLTYRIYPIDFVQEILSKQDNLFEPDIPKYDLVIANPPYFKIPSNSLLGRSARLNGVSGSTNIYSLIMSLSKDLLNDKGELIFIIPRSFCSGLYFKNFRRSMLSELSLDYIHNFASRRDAFAKDDVLQENIIVKMSKRPQVKSIRLSSSNGLLDLSQVKPRTVDVNEVIDNKSGHFIISIPSSKEDDNIIDIIQSWTENLHHLNMEISTGPIVSFRCTSWLTEKPSDYPLIWLNNVKPMEVNWPLKDLNRPQHIKHCAEAMKWLISDSNYVLLRRFSAKEDKQRLVAAPLLKNTLGPSFLGIENHVNFIHRPKGILTIDEVYGISALLNSNILNRYFQIINGHTQVNATELRILPLPKKEIIIRLGRQVRKTNDWLRALSDVLREYFSNSKKGKVLLNV